MEDLAEKAQEIDVAIPVKKGKRNTSQKKARDTGKGLWIKVVQPQSRGFFHESFLGQATRLFRNQRGSTDCIYFRV